MFKRTLLRVAATAAMLWGASPLLACPKPGEPGAPIVFSQNLPDMPGKCLVAVELTFPPKKETKDDPEHAHTPARPIGHIHPGSVLVYVTKGRVRIGLKDQPVEVLETGQTFYEPPNVVHTVAESASATEPAAAIAVLIVPEGSPILKPAFAE